MNKKKRAPLGGAYIKKKTKKKHLSQSIQHTSITINQNGQTQSCQTQKKKGKNGNLFIYPVLKKAQMLL